MTNSARSLRLTSVEFRPSPPLPLDSGARCRCLFRRAPQASQHPPSSRSSRSSRRTSRASAGPLRRALKRRLRKHRSTRFVVDYRKEQYDDYDGVDDDDDDNNDNDYAYDMMDNRDQGSRTKPEVDNTPSATRKPDTSRHHQRDEFCNNDISVDRSSGIDKSRHASGFSGYFASVSQPRCGRKIPASCAPTRCFPPFRRLYE